jgi:hypothetical protein
VKYPTITHEKLVELAQDFLGKADLERADLERVEAASSLEGSGQKLDLRRLKTKVTNMRQEHGELLEDFDYQADPDRIEGKLAPMLHEGLRECGMEDEALDDAGFWRYLALANFWWFLVWRHHTCQPRVDRQAFKEGGNYLRYLEHKKHEVSVLARMYIRAELALDDGSFELSWKGKTGTDVWQSHLIPVGTGFSPVLARALLRRQVRDYKETDTLREIAKLIKRSNTNLVHIDSNDDMADAFIDYHWSHPSLKTAGGK